MPGSRPVIVIEMAAGGVARSGSAARRLERIVIEMVTATKAVR